MRYEKQLEALRFQQLEHGHDFEPTLAIQAGHFAQLDVGE